LQNLEINRTRPPVPQHHQRAINAYIAVGITTRYTNRRATGGNASAESAGIMPLMGCGAGAG
jgi:hypothetical protein